ncbi:MAG: hypothetical protein Q4P26_03885 [Lachnospiraceae bacterium]|nr:hypothetical protein [Lachnospiraceae bacterium]
MKFRKAMMALAMSSAMVMAVPGVLEAKTTSFEDEGVVYYKVEQDGTVKSIAEEDYEAARKEAGSQEQETEVDVSDESSYSGIIFNGEADGSWYISEDDDRVVMSGGKASAGETTEEDTTVMTQGGENESGAVYFQSVENSADAYGTYSTKEEAKRSKEYGEAGITQDDDGSWMWEGQKVRILLDDDGSIYMSNADQKKENGVYLYVERNESGEIKKVNAVDAKEILEELALCDAQKDE